MRKNSMDSLSCPAGTGMWRIKMKIKKPSHIIKGGGFRMSKIMFHLRTQIQIPSDQHSSICGFYCKRWSHAPARGHGLWR